MRDELVIGRIRTAFGLAGEVKVELFASDIGYLEQLGSVTIVRSGVREERHIRSVRANGATCLVLFDGIETPEQAKELSNAELLVDRERANPPAPGEFYYADLVDLLVFAEGAEAGVVCDILEGNGAVFLEVKTGTGEKRLIPFSRDFVLDVELEAGRLTVSSRELLE